MSDDNQACEVPLIEKLRSVPIDRPLQFEPEPNHWRSIPVGIYCHEAADRISALERELAEAKAELAEFRRTEPLKRAELKALREENEGLRELLAGRECEIDKLKAHEHHLVLCRAEAGCSDDETLAIHCRELRESVKAWRECAEALGKELKTAKELLEIMCGNPPTKTGSLMRTIAAFDKFKEEEAK